METGDRFQRQTAFFGKDGQEKLSRIRAVVVGTGGIGSHVIQQLAFLGVGSITMIDGDPIEETNLNRLVGYRNGDKIGTPKVQIATRNVNEINSVIKISQVVDSFISADGYDALKKANFVFGCVDNDGARLVLNEFCLAYELPLIDIASDILFDGSEYGGRIVTVVDESGCLYCAGEIDPVAAGIDLENPDARRDREAIYGVKKDALSGTGPSVVSINGVVASFGVTEFMLHVTGKRKGQFIRNYLGSRGIINSRSKEHNDCYYCKSVRGTGDRANMQRYLK